MSKEKRKKYTLSYIFSFYLKLEIAFLGTVSMIGSKFTKCSLKPLAFG